MRPCLSENEAVAFVGGQVSPEDRIEIAAHLDSCSACLGVVAGTASQPAPLETPAEVAVTPPGPGTVQRARMVALALVTLVVAGTGALFLSRPAGSAETFPRALAILRDESAALGAEAVAAMPESAFRETRTAHPNFGFTRDAVWLRLKVQNPEPVPRDVVLDATREWVTEVDLFEIVGAAAKPLARSGARVPLAERPIVTERIAFPLTLAAGQTRTLLIRLHGSSPLSFRGDLSTRAAFTSREAGDQLLFGGFYAILWGLAAYSLLLFATLRDRTQLLVGIVLGFYGLAEAASHGHLSRLFPIGAGWFEISGGAALPGPPGAGLAGDRAARPRHARRDRVRQRGRGGAGRVPQLALSGLRRAAGGVHRHAGRRLAQRPPRRQHDVLLPGNGLSLAHGSADAAGPVRRHAGVSVHRIRQPRRRRRDELSVLAAGRGRHPPATREDRLPQPRARGRVGGAALSGGGTLAGAGQRPGQVRWAGRGGRDPARRGVRGTLPGAAPPRRRGVGSRLRGGAPVRRARVRTQSGDAGALGRGGGTGRARGRDRRAALPT